MSVRITSQESRVALFDSASGMAFGPTFANEGDAQAFLEHLADVDGRDPRDIPSGALRPLYDRWTLQHECSSGHLTGEMLWPGTAHQGVKCQRCGEFLPC